MEQQKEQPIQEKVESKSPIKTNWKFIVIVAILTLLLGGGVWWYVNSLLIEPQTSQIVTPIEKQEIKWFGLLVTEEGLVKINSLGVSEKDFSKFNLLGKLLEDGRIVFVGFPKQALAPKENVLYTWRIDFQENPKPFLEIEPPLKISSFAVSPESTQVAVIAVTRTISEVEKEALRLFTEQGLEQSQSKIQALENQLLEELRTVKIYDTKTGKVVKTLQKEWSFLSSRKVYGEKLIWNKIGLFVIDRPEILVFESKNWQIIDTIPDKQVGSILSLVETILISPDGTKYFLRETREIREIPGNKLIGTINIPELADIPLLGKIMPEPTSILWVGPAAFSQDSKKVLAQYRSSGQTNFVILEFDTETKETRTIGDSSLIRLLPYEEEILREEMKSSFYFITYSPGGEGIIFASNLPTLGKKSSTDLFWLKLGEQKAELRASFETSTRSFGGQDVYFAGWWYKASSQLPSSERDTSTPSTGSTSSPQASSGQAWQTYRNDEFGFELRYPLEYGNKSGCVPHVYQNGTPLLFVGPITFSFEDPKGLSLKEYVDKIERETRPDPKNGIFENEVLSREKVTIDGVEGERIISRGIAAGGFNPHVVYLQRGARILRIIYDDGVLNHCPIKLDELPSETASQILSTFRFVEQEDSY